MEYDQFSFDTTAAIARALLDLASEPSASEPSASEPSASEPSASEPSASEPSASDPEPNIQLIADYNTIPTMAPTQFEDPVLSLFLLIMYSPLMRNLNELQNNSNININTSYADVNPVDDYITYIIHTDITYYEP